MLAALLGQENGIVPGLLSLLVVTFVIYLIDRPEIRETPQAAQIARDELAKMGKVTRDELVVLGTFMLALALWMTGSVTHLEATVVALLGLGLMLLFGTLTWDDVLGERTGWDTLIWFGGLVGMATMLSKLGLFKWFSGYVSTNVTGMEWLPALVLIVLLYTYSGYLFASLTAHTVALYAPMLTVAVAVGAPPLFAALLLAFFSSLCVSLTHYAGGPAPVYFGSAVNNFGIQLLLDGTTLPELAPRLRTLPVPVLIDHMGHMPASLGADHPAFRALCALLRDAVAVCATAGEVVHRNVATSSAVRAVFFITSCLRVFRDSVALLLRTLPQRRGLQRQRRGRRVVEISRGVTGRHGVRERQRARPRAGGVVHHRVGRAGLQGQLRRAGHGDGLAERHLDGDRLAGLVRPVRGGRGDAGARAPASPRTTFGRAAWCGCAPAARRPA